MDHLWSPWRYRYVSSDTGDKGCIFCNAAASPDDKANYIVHRAERNFVILNAFPYTTGHIMIAPYAHVSTLGAADGATLQEAILLAQKMEAVLRGLYRPEGLNLGYNIGKSAGAGIAGHIHMHVLPRWSGDVNFMTSIGETRVLPEDLETTYERLTEKLKGSAA